MGNFLGSVVFLTVAAILVSSLLGVVLSRRRKDVCLKDFGRFLVTLQEKTGKRIWGRLSVETSGMEFQYKGNYWDQDHIETSFIVYKEEFGNMHILFRFHDELTEKGRKRRLRSLERSYHPAPPRRILRYVRNLLNSIKDAINESLSATVSMAKTASPGLKVLSSQQKYVNRAQGELIEQWGAAYDPILEKHIGNMVVMEVTSPEGEIIEYVGVFKEYSPQFLEVMDVNYKDGDKERICDMITLRAYSAIRHSAEPVPHSRSEKDAAGSVTS